MAKISEKELLQIIEKAKAEKQIDLNLSNKGITKLPPEIGNLTNLELLYLSNNQLTTLPTEICNLTNLEFFELSNNKLTTLLTEICKLTNLKYLYLSNNQLTTLPTVIGNLTNLRHLYLSNNRLTTLPTEINNLINLQFLSLRNSNSKNANFRSIKFINASFTGSDLQGADLSNASLHNADLTDVDLRGANLSNTDFTGAIFSSTRISRRSDLSTAKFDSDSVIGLVFEQEDDDFIEAEREKREKRALELFKEKKGILCLKFDSNTSPYYFSQTMAYVSIIYEGIRIYLTTPKESRDLVLENSDLFGTFEDNDSLKIKEIRHGSILPFLEGYYPLLVIIASLTLISIQSKSIKKSDKFTEEQIELLKAQVETEKKKAELLALQKETEKQKGQLLVAQTANELSSLRQNTIDYSPEEQQQLFEKLRKELPYLSEEETENLKSKLISVLTKLVLTLKKFNISMSIKPVDPKDGEEQEIIKDGKAVEQKKD